MVANQIYNIDELSVLIMEFSVKHRFLLGKENHVRKVIRFQGQNNDYCLL